MFAARKPAHTGAMNVASTDAIDACVEAELSRTGPGAVVGVMRGGTLVHAKGYGLADLSWSAPATPDTIFSIASVSKPLTAMAIMLLRDSGALSLDDPLSKHMPVTLAGGDEVTIRRLLTHTSGLHNYNADPSFYEGLAQRGARRDQLLTFMLGQASDFTPGERYAYSNTGCVLLSLLIEHLSGQRFGEFMRLRIFEPLGMQRTLHLNDRIVLANRATGYQIGARGLQLGDFVSTSWTFGAGGIASTANDLAKLCAALDSGDLLAPGSFTEMLEPARLNDGSTYPYGLGWGVARYCGHAVHHHTGGVRRGFTCELMRFPETQTSVILLTNNFHFPFHRIACAIARAALSVAPTRRRAVAVDAALVRAIAGAYRGGDGAEFSIEAEGFTQRYAATEGGCFFDREDQETELRIVWGGGRVVGIEVATPMFTPVRYERVER